MKRILMTACAALAVTAIAGPVTFVGGSAVDSKDWFLCENWSAGAVPSATDDVVVSNHCVVVTNALEVRSLTLKGAAVFHVRAKELADDSVFSSSSNAASALWSAATVVSVRERFDVTDRATVIPEAANLTGVPVVFRVRDILLAEGASFDAVQRGWGWDPGPVARKPKFATGRVSENRPTETYWTLAPGAGRDYNRGGTYVNGGRPYAPFLPGSPSGNYYANTENPNPGRGPGSIVILSRGKAVFDGKLIADAERKPGEGGDGSRASGGGIWLSLQDFDFGAKALLSAQGGVTYGPQFGPGKGGQVCVCVGLSETEEGSLAKGDQPTDLSYREDLPLVRVQTRDGFLRGAAPVRSGGRRTMVLGSRAKSVACVQGVPEWAEGVTPRNGALTFGGAQRFEAPAYGFCPTNERIRRACLGHLVTNSTRVVAKGSARQVVVSGSREPSTVVWQWGAPEYDVQVAAHAHAALKVDGKLRRTGFSEWTKGPTTAVEVVPDKDWVFLRWEGDVPEGMEETNPLAFTARAPVTLKPVLIYGEQAKQTTLVALPTTNSCVYAEPLPIVGQPGALGVELAGDTTGARIVLKLVDAEKKTFEAAFPAAGPFTRRVLSERHWRGPEAKARMKFPLSLAAVTVVGGKVQLKSVRAAYTHALGRAENHFAALESIGQKLGGAFVREKTKSVSVPAEGGAGVRLVLHGSRGNAFSIVWDDGSRSGFDVFVRDDVKEDTTAPFLGRPKGTFPLPDAEIQIGPFRQRVLPSLQFYGNRCGIVPMGWDYLADWQQLPGAREHVLDLTFRTGGKGSVLVYSDGSLACTVPPPKGCPDARAKEVAFCLGEGAEYAVKAPESGYDADRYEVLDFAANPRAKAFKDARIAEGDCRVGRITLLEGVPLRIADPIDSGDVAICRMAKGEWAMEVNEYTGRSPLSGFGSAIHYRVPAKDYVRAHVVFALDPDERKEKVMTLRLAHYFLNGAGPNMIGDVKIDLSKGIGKDVRKIGEIDREGVRLPLYATSVALRNGPVKAEAARKEYLDFDIFGSSPSPKQPSAFNVFGVTLESMPLTLDVVAKPDAPSNVFTKDEPDRHLTLRLRGEDASSGHVSWSATDFSGQAVFRGERKVGPLAKGETHDIRIDLDEVEDPGLYFLDLAVRDESGSRELRYQTRFAVLPESGRVVRTEDSPYATWWFFGPHGSPADWKVGGPLLQKAGIRKASHGNWPTNEMARYGVTYTGHVGCPHPNEFDPQTGHFRPHGKMDGEEWFVADVKSRLSRVPYADHMLVWHESAPGCGCVPEEVLDLPVPKATEKDRAAAAYVNEVGRLVRKHFPGLRLQFGNSHASIGAACLPFRGGADPQYFDSIGIEAPSQIMMPERLLVWSIQGMVIAKEAAAYHAKRSVPAAACFEYVYRSENVLGEELQAAWYMRDVLISLANGMPLISPAILFDAKNQYYDSVWGMAGMLRRAPYGEPKLSYVAYAALTKALDGVKLVRELDTGSTTAYAFLYRRADGRYATAIWCARGEAELEFDVDGKGTVMDMIGRESKLGGFFRGKKAWASERPSYVITDSPVKEVRIVGRTFRQAELIASRTHEIYRFAETTSVSNAPDPRVKSHGHGCLPIMRPSDHFAAKTVEDDEKGRCLELTLDTSKEAVNRYYTEYTTLRLTDEKKPVITDASENGRIGIWVKGNSSWGQVRFELTDADGDVFVNYGHPWDYDDLDWPGLLCVNFDGWAFVNCRLPAKGNVIFHGAIRADRELGLSNAPWRKEGWARQGNGKVDYPLTLTALTVGMNRTKLDVLDFKPTDPTIRLGGVGVER